MQHGERSTAPIRFGLFEVDPRLGILTKQGARLPLQELPFQALVFLLQRPGELVEREELHAHLWPDTIVDFDHGLNKAINKIRDVLADSANSPRFIETVARRGYRFIADVSVVEPNQAGIPALAPEPPPVTSPPATSAQPPAAQPRKRARYWGAFAGAVVFIVAVGMATWWFTRKPATPPAVRSLAVLPLEDLSADGSQEYFADGMTDELITQLAQIGALRVISRSSVMAYKKMRKPLAQIARELDVQAIVEGSVLVSGSRVRITAQLIRVPADEHIWANNYEGDLRDTLKLQSEVAQSIATHVRVTLSPKEQAALRDARQVDPNAYEAYLKGRYFWNKRTGPDLKTAIDYFSAAVTADPNYAAAYAGLADSFALAGDWEYGLMSPQEAWRQASQAARKALALDENLGAAHASLAFSLDLYAWNWSAAELQYQRAIALSPNYATAHHWYAFHLLVLGRNQEAIAELRKAQSLDPLSLIISADIADTLCIAHLYDQSIEQSSKTLAMDPNFALAHYEMGQALEQKHLYDQAIRYFKQAIEHGGHSAAFDSNLAHAYAVSGHRDAALRILKELEARQDQYPAAYANIALAYVGLGDFDSALARLEQAYAAHVNPSILLRPAFDPIRADPRFESLLERIREFSP